MKAPTIRLLLDLIEDDELVLPAMQRPFVWQEERILRLMDSLMRLFPIGTILVWETDEAQRFRRFSHDAVSGEQPMCNFPHAGAGKRLQYVLDGQQRLTSLNIAARGSLDHRRLYLNVLSGDPLNKDPGDMYFEFRFLSEADLLELSSPADPDAQERHFIPFEQFRRIDPVHGMQLATELALQLKLDSGRFKRLVENFSRAVNIMSSQQAVQLHVVDEHGQTRTPITEILELFVRVNSGGLVLQKADLLMSLLDLSWNDVQPALLQVARKATDLSPVPITRDLVLKSALLSVDEESRFDKLVKDRDHIEKIAPQLRNALADLERGWLKLASMLKGDCRIHSPRFFRQATNALLPFAIFLAEHPSPPRSEEHRLVTGIYMALMSGIFGAAEARMGTFARRRVRGASEFPLKSLAELVKAHTGIRDLDGLLHHHRDLTLNIAQGGVILDGNPDELERDHIFPKATLAAAQTAERRINHYANFHFLRRKDNRNKTDRPPHEWFRQPGPEAPSYSDQDMDDRLLCWELIEPGAFDRLIAERGARMRAAACRLFHCTEEEFNHLFS